jgi:hypothetical protein
MRFFLSFLITLGAFAQTGIINTKSIQDDLDYYYNIYLAQVYLGNQIGRITFTKKWPLEKGSYLLAKISEEKICKLPILEIGEKEGKVNLTQCPFRKELTRNLLLSLPPLMVEVDKNYRDNSMSTAESIAIGDLPSKNESWYIFSSLGIAPIEYAPSINESIQSFTGENNMNNLGLSLDALGIYWPLKNNKSIFGGVLGLVYEDYKTQGVFSETPTTTINQWANLKFWQYSLTASFMHFFGQNVGDGIFLRGDLGISSFSGTLNVSYTANNSDLQGENQDFSYEWGPSFLLGGGYSWPLSLSTRFMGTLSYSVKSSYYNGEITANRMLIASLGLLF